MSSTEREQRLKFLSLTERDEQLLKALRPLFEKYVDAVEDEFYDHLLSFPETAQLLRDRTTVERLKKLQHDYLMRITEGNFDDAYLADRLRVGQTHERVGLSPRWYLIAYSQYFKIIAPLILDYYPDDSKRAAESIVALEKVFMLDASLAMDAYIASDRVRHLQQLESIVNDSADVIFSLDAWLTMARRTAASCMRICFCSGGGKIEITRLIVSTASSVCKVENTMWPVSAACSAVEIVSKSRISPTENYVRILTQRCAQCRAKPRRIHPNLALIDVPLLIAMQKFDRIFNRNNVFRARRVHPIHHRRQRRRFAGPRNPRHQHQPAWHVADLLHDFRQEQFVKRSNFRWNDAQHQSHVAALLENVHTEASQAGHAVRHIDFRSLFELLFLPRRHHTERHVQHVLGADARLFGQRHQLTVNPQMRIVPHLQMQVAGSPFRSNPKQIINIHAGSFPGNVA